jgi:hypothetical protein
MPTLRQIGKHLGLSHQVAGEQMEKLGLSNTYQTMTLDEIRIAYLERQRAVASGHLATAADDSGQTVNALYERALKERRERQVLELKLSKRVLEICNRDGLMQKLDKLARAIKNEMYKGDSVIVKQTLKRYGVKVDIALIHAYSDAALAHLTFDDVFTNQERKEVSA